MAGFLHKATVHAIGRVQSRQFTCEVACVIGGAH